MLKPSLSFMPRSKDITLHHLTLLTYFNTILSKVLCAFITITLSKSLLTVFSLRHHSRGSSAIVDILITVPAISSVNRECRYSLPSPLSRDSLLVENTHQDCINYYVDHSQSKFQISQFWSRISFSSHHLSSDCSIHFL